MSNGAVLSDTLFPPHSPFLFCAHTDIATAFLVNFYYKACSNSSSNS